MSLRGILVVVALAVLGGCAAPPPPPPPAPPPTITLLNPDQACLAELDQDHVAFRPLQSFGIGRCHIANPVRLSGRSPAWNRPGVLSCEMARRLVEFEDEVVQPLAQRYFGQGVRRLNHYGTYDCRTRRNAASVAAARMGTSRGGRLSEHAMGRAIDVAGFQLDDGTEISVRRDWWSGGSRGQFLRALARASCDRFSVVLTPNHDRLHRDHIHLDIGPYTLCGI